MICYFPELLKKPIRYCFHIARPDLLIIILLFFIPYFSQCQSVLNYGGSYHINQPYVTIANSSPTRFTWTNYLNYNMYNDDYVSDSTNIGFTFTYNGINYTKFRASVNGFLTFDLTTQPTYESSSYYSYQPGQYSHYDYFNGSSFTSTPGTTNSLAAYYSDQYFLYPCQFNLSCLDSTMYYKLSGTAPNRMLTIEWRNVTDYGSDQFNFQIKLYETSNNIEYCYGNFVGTSDEGIIGINAATISSANDYLIATYTGNPGNCRFYNYNSGSLLPEANSIIRFTLGDPPCNAVSPASNLVSSDITKTSLSVKFNRSPDASYYYILRTTIDTLLTVSTGLHPTGITGIDFKEIAEFTTDTSFIDSDLEPNTTYYYWVYSIKEAGCSGPRPFINQNAISIALTTLPCTGTAGVVVIGPGGTFTTLTDAINHYENTGLTGPTIFQVNNNYNPASETYPIVFQDSIQCVNSTNTITLRPAPIMASPKNILSNNGDATLILNNINNITIDGRKGGVGVPNFLNIENTSTGGAAIKISNASSSNTIRYSIIKGVSTSQQKGVIMFKNDENTSYEMSNNTIDHCTIQNGVTRPVNLIYAKGNNLIEFDDYIGTSKSNSILYCNLLNHHSSALPSYGIYSDDMSEWQIKYNHFYQTSALSTDTIASTIRLIDGINHNVKGNHIGGSGINSSGSKMSFIGNVRYSSIDIHDASYEDGNWNENDNYVYNTYGYAASNIDSNVVKNILITSNKQNILVKLGGGNINFGINHGNQLGGNTINDSLKFNLNTTSNFAIIEAKSGNTQNVQIKNNTINNVTVVATNTPVAMINIGDISEGWASIDYNTIGQISGNTRSINITTDGNVGIINADRVSNVNVRNNTLQNIKISAPNHIAYVYGILCKLAGQKDIKNNLIKSISVTNDNPVLTGIYSNSGNSIELNYGDCIGNIIENIGTSSTDSVVHKVIGIEGDEVIEDNFIHSLYINNQHNSSNIYGIYTYSTNIKCINNRIRLGINYNGTPYTAKPNIYGIYLQSVFDTKIFHNSIYIGGSANNASASSALYLLPYTGEDDIFIQNNIFQNVRSNSGTGLSYALYANVGNPHIFKLNNNIYYNSGSNTLPFRSNSTFYTSLFSWQNASKSDYDSGLYNPNFINPTGDSLTINLHLQSPTPANNFGVELSEVPFDFDGEARSESMPDVGADEGTFTKVDVSPPLINYAKLPPACNTNNRILNVSIKDSTGLPITGILRPRIYYKKGSTGTYFDRAGTLTTGTAQNGQWSFTINNTDMGGVSDGDNIYYFIVAEDNSPQQNIVSLPRGAFGTATDTLSNTPSQSDLYNYTVRTSTALAGNYNVGTGQTYTSILDAVNAYNSGCLADDVTFLLTDSIYNISSVLISYNNTASESSTLKIRPTKINTVITGNDNEAVIKLKGAQYVTIDGSFGNIANDDCSDLQPSRHLTISNTSSGTSSAIIHLDAGFTGIDTSSNCSILNCKLLGNNTSTYAGVWADANTALEKFNTLSIMNNAISQCKLGVYVNGYSTANKNKNIYIVKNSIDKKVLDNFMLYGILVYDADYVFIKGNSIGKIKSNSTSSVAGIIAGVSSILSASDYGTLNNITNCTITNNIVDSIIHTNGRSAVGIAMSYISETTNVISNNTINYIYANNSPSYVTAGIMHGGTFSSNTLGKQIIAHNTIALQGNIEGSAPVTGTLANIFFTYGPYSNTHLHNNIFGSNLAGNTGSAANYCNIRTQTTNISIGFLSDKNSFYWYNTGIGNFATAITGSTLRYTFQDWQSFSQRDSNSFFKAPFFESSSNLKLRSVAYNTAFDNTALNIEEVAEDINCYARSSSPDIGAYEFIACNKNNATAIAGSTGQTIQVTQNINISNFINDDCLPIAIVSPGGYLPVKGDINVKLKIDDTIAIFNGRPLGKRIYDLRPAKYPNAATARVTLFYTQQDFDAYNLQNGSYSELPISPGDSVGYKNLRILQFHGVSYNGTPQAYTGNMYELDPGNTDIVWNNKLRAYEVSFNVYGFSGFYLSSAAPICRGAEIKYVATIPGNVYQWQVNNGSGYANIVNGGIYSGATDDTLIITNPPTSYYGYKYQCKVNNTNDEVHDLYFYLIWQGDVNSNWGALGNWGCNVLPDEFTHVLIEGGTPFAPQVNINNAKARTLHLKDGGTLQINNTRSLRVGKL